MLCSRGLHWGVLGEFGGGNRSDGEAGGGGGQS